MAHSLAGAGGSEIFGGNFLIGKSAVTQVLHMPLPMCNSTTTQKFLLNSKCKVVA